MLRAASPLTRRAPLQYGSIRAALIRAQQAVCGIVVDSSPGTNLRFPQRTFADKPTIKDPTPPVLPGSQSTTVKTPAPAPPDLPKPVVVVNPNTVSGVPKIPPPPPPNPHATQSNASGPKKRPRRLRRFLLYLVLLSGVGYGASVWYALVSDNFHDFFTEYVPFGEDAVLYFEEREFQKRFPRALAPSSRKHDSPRVTIPGNSGLTWKETQPSNAVTEIDKKGPYNSAIDRTDSTPKPQSSSAPAKAPASKATKPETSAPTSPSKPASTSQSQNASANPTSAVHPKLKEDKATKKESSPKEEQKSSSAAAGTATSGVKKSPEVDEPSVYIPITRIDPLNIPNANEPVVQDLVKVLNDLILVINADNSSSKMASSVEKAKTELSKVGSKIMDMKKAADNVAEERLKSSEAEFEGAARELVRRLEDDIREQESKWREEFESERRKISTSYEERLAAEVKRITETVDQKSRNQLLEQAISLKKDFSEEAKDIVEKERNGRLSRLSELSSSVEELDKLASAWNSVIDSNLQTQHLQVAVEAVRANIEHSGGRPFIKELAALKEIAADDAVISSAIASINPVAYQRGIPTSAQLIDRFRGVADEVRKASLLPEDAGVASHAASLVFSKILFKKQGRAVGDDVESILTRTETLLEEGDFDEAAREMTGLTGWAKTLSRDWLTEIRRVLEVRQALDVRPPVTLSFSTKKASTNYVFQIIATEARLQSLKVD